MPAPSNTTAANAIVVTAAMLPYNNTQQVDFAGTTYDVWYRFDATFDGVIGFWAYGGDTGPYKAGHFLWSPTSTNAYMGNVYNALPSNLQLVNRPVLLAVEAGKSYWFEIPPNSGNPTPANLTVSILRAPDNTPQTGDFISNRELDLDYEQPLTVLSGTVNYQVRKFVQMAPPLPAARTSANFGLPHGDNGVITSDGHIVYLDEQYLIIKIYDKNFALSATITRYSSLPDLIIGPGASRATFFVMYGSSSTGMHLEECDSSGAVINTWAFPYIAGWGYPAVNVGNTRLYMTGGTVGVVKVVDLTTSTYLTDFPAFTGYSIYDIIVMPTGEVLAIFLGPGGTPKDVQAKRYNATGTVLNSYTFGGNLWRDSFNPPHLGYALDNNSFWVKLAPHPQYELTRLRNIRISDGTQLAEVLHANYLFGSYIDWENNTGQPITPLGRFGPEKSFRVMLAPPSLECVPTPTPSSFSIPAGGSIGNVVNVAVGAGCDVPITPPPWIPPTTPPSCTGNCSFTFDVPANPGPPRTGTILVSGVPVTVNQAAMPDMSGIYYINPVKSHDSYYGGIELKIPDPTWRTALMGN